MKRSLVVIVTVLAGAGLVFVGVRGCSQGGADRLNGGGSTFVYPMMSKWAAEYEQATGAQVNYQSIGSGGGIQQMTAKTFDFGCTDAPMTDEQIQKCRENGADPIHVPLVLGAVVPVYNLEGVDETVRFSGPVLAAIFLGKVKRWNDPALRELNPDAQLPDKEIVVIHRSDGSGTTYIWVDYLAKVSPGWRSEVGVGTSVDWPTGIGQKGNEGVAGQVRRSPGSIGYVELIYAVQNDIKFGEVRNRAGRFVTASMKSVTAAAAAALTEIPEDLRFSITDPAGEESYPISGTVWAVVYAKLPSRKGQQIVDFLRWVTHEGQGHAEGLHYARLPEGLVKRLEKRLDSIQVGE